MSEHNHEEQAGKEIGEKATRYLNLFDMGASALPSNFVPDDKGGLLVKNVPVLKSGTWTDSYSQTPLFYPVEVLKKFAGNWTNNGIWTRHAGGEPRRITEKVGEVRNPRFEEGEQGVVADLFYHGLTGESRDTIALIKAGMTDAVSVELRDMEIYNPALKRMEAVSLRFDGLANVDKGACKSCTIKRNEAQEDKIMADEKEKQLSEMETKIVESKKALEEATAKIAEKEKSLSEATAKNADLAKKLAEVEEKVKRLESIEAEQKSRKPAEGSETETHELSECINADIVVKNGIVSRRD